MQNLERRLYILHARSVHLQGQAEQSRELLYALTARGCCRWRSLEGNDPGAYELTMKCQALQRRLIQSIELGVEKEARITELEGLRDELKAILARQPGAESALLISELQVHPLAAACSAHCQEPFRKKSLLLMCGKHLLESFERDAE